jgi:hypothetical protein
MDSKLEDLEYEIARMKVEYLHFISASLAAVMKDDKTVIERLYTVLQSFLEESKTELDDLIERASNNR